MFRLSFGVARAFSISFLLFFFSSAFVVAQVETATLSGQVVDSSGLRVAGALVDLVDIDRGSGTSVATDNSGLYRFPSVHPGRYRMQVRASGFRVIDVTGLTVNVQDHLEQNFKLAVGSVSESITVEGGAPLVDTETGTVSTVINRNFAENLPMNGRSFQTLIELTPGVVLTTSNIQDSGQFSVNGQRATSNYWMVDGVSANVGINSTLIPGNGLGGALGSFSAQGGTNSLVSVDAMQEFRIQTSTYAPEFGRTPGGQISISTRSGTNEFHGTVFDFLRNDALDAGDWFNGYTNHPALPKAKERQNDFGGVLGGPLVKDRTFFFFSYEGLRLRLPQTALTSVPDRAYRSNAIASLQPYLDAYPVPNGPEILDQAGNPTGAAAFNASFSDTSSLDAYSLRLDHKLNKELNVFVRYNYSPSNFISRGGQGGIGPALSVLNPNRYTAQTATIGTTWVISSKSTNDVRFNYSRTAASSSLTLDNFGGALPLTTLSFPPPYTSANSFLSFDILSLSQGTIDEGQSGHNVQRQFNIVDNFSLARGSHSLKFGVDFRRLSPTYGNSAYNQSPNFLDVPSTSNGDLAYSIVGSGRTIELLLHNLGLFAQDTWRTGSRLTLTYGLRWDIDFVPSTASGPNFLAVSNFIDPFNLQIAPAGTPPYKTSYANLAPRLGVAYQASNRANWTTVVKGGIGSFYDLATSEIGNALQGGRFYPFGASSTFLGTAFGGSYSFPLPPAQAAPPAITASQLSSGILSAFDPHLNLPYTLEWNVRVEQGVGQQQVVSSAYIGSIGRRLLQSEQIVAANPTYYEAYLVGNSATSDYNALQLQFERRMNRGLQALVSYTLAHAIDTASAGSAFGNEANAGAPGLNPRNNRASSDFDIRNAFSAGVSYDVPNSHFGALPDAILNHWSVQTIVQSRSATPVNVYDSAFYQPLDGDTTQFRPDLVPGKTLYLFGSEYPGGKALNPLAFIPPPVDPTTGAPSRQGNLGRNALRGFGASQWDLAIHRDFPIHESIKLQFRAEMFNVLNHPNFGPPQADMSKVNFGLSTQTLGQSLGGGTVGTGGLSSLYQIGGPRSIQLALKLFF